MDGTHRVREDALNEFDRFRARRDEDSFRRLYCRCTPAIFGLALRLCAGRRDRAEDVVQETWIRAIRNIDRFEGRSAPSTWLGGIAVHVWRETDRQERRRRETDDVPERTAALPEEAHDLPGALAVLPAGCREILVLHDVEGYTHAEIADLLGVDAGTSKSQLHRARDLLRRHLRPPCANGSGRQR